MTSYFGAKRWRPGVLQDLVLLQRGFDITKSQQTPGEIPVYSSSGLSSWHNEAMAQGPGVIIGRKGTLGSVHYSPGDYWPHDTTLWSKSLRNNNPKFVYYALKCLGFERFNVGGANPTLNRNHIHGLPIFIPDLTTQDAIVAVLATYDDLIENNRRRIALLAEAARLLYREWFVHLRFPGHEHVKVVDGVPTGWHRRVLSELCFPRIGIQTGPFGSQLHQSDYTEQGVPVVMPKDLRGFRVESDGIARIPEELADRLGRHRMQVGDTVYGRRGDIGRRAFIGRRQNGWLCGTGSLRIRPDAGKIVPRYLFETLGAPQTAGFIANQAKGSTMPNLSAGALQRVPIVCPPMSLQLTFVEAIEPLSEQVEVLSEQNQKLTVARDLSLPRLMNGELAV